MLWVPLVLLDLEECLPLAQMVCSLYTGSYVLYTKGLSNNVSQPKDTLDWGMGTLTTKGIFFYPGGLMVSVYIAALLYFYIASFLHCCISTYCPTYIVKVFQHYPALFYLPQVLDWNHQMMSAFLKLFNFAHHPYVLQQNGFAILFSKSCFIVFLCDSLV